MTAEAKVGHTPGPWRVPTAMFGDDIEVYHPTTGGMVRPICTMHGEGDVTEANARLIASAPDLLAACEEAADTILAEVGNITDESVDGPMGEVYATLMRAIARARGEQP